MIEPLESLIVCSYLVRRGETFLLFRLVEDFVLEADRFELCFFEFFGFEPDAFLESLDADL